MVSRWFMAVRPDFPESFNHCVEPVRRELNRFVFNTPDRFERRWVLRKARDQMPMDVRKLIAEQFIIDFHCAPFLRQNSGQGGYLFDENATFVAREVKQFRGMAFQHQ